MSTGEGRDQPREPEVVSNDESTPDAGFALEDMRMNADRTMIAIISASAPLIGFAFIGLLVLAVGAVSLFAIFARWD